MRTLRKILKEAIQLDVEKGDIILTGRFKNKRRVVKTIGTDRFGQPTINGKSILKFKIEKHMPKNKMSAKTREEMNEVKRRKHMKELRKTIRQILLETTDKKPLQFKDGYDIAYHLKWSGFAELHQKGYGVMNVEEDHGSHGGKAQRFIVALQHKSPDFKRFIDELQSRGGKFDTIYGDTPKSKTKIVRYLTGYKEGADIDPRQKAAAIKVAQLAGMDAMDVLIDGIEAKFDCTCVANFLRTERKGKGRSVFELYVFPGEITDPDLIRKPSSDNPVPFHDRRAY